MYGSRAQTVQTKSRCALKLEVDYKHFDIHSGSMKFVNTIGTTKKLKARGSSTQTYYSLKCSKFPKRFNASRGQMT